MDRVVPTVTPPATVTDGFGQRTIGVDSETGEQVELLEFAPEIVEHTAFVTALAERVARFATVRHASYVHLRRVDRPSADRLQMVSDFTPGWRLSEVLDESAAANIPVDISVVIALLRQLLPAVALFGRHNRENAIGALSPHRLIVTPQARLVIAEHAFGPALEKLNYGRDKMWREFRVTMPPSAGLPRANSRADAHAIGVVALTLLRGRPLALDEFPSQLEFLVEEAQEHREAQGGPISPSFKTWLKRALQFDPANAFQSASEAQLAFESVLASDRSYVTNSPLFGAWVKQTGGAIDFKRRLALAALPPQLTIDDEGDEARAEPVPERVAEPELVITRSNGDAAASATEAAPEEERQPELIAEADPAPEPEVVAVVPQPVEEIVAPEPVEALATEPVAEEIEVALDEPAVAPAEPSTVAERGLDTDAPIEEPEAESIEEAPRAAFTREQLEEDPIARALLTYQPALDPPAAPTQELPEPDHESELAPEPALEADVDPELPIVEPQPESEPELIAAVDEEPQAVEPEPEPELESEPVAEAASPYEESDPPHHALVDDEQPEIVEEQSEVHRAEPEQVKNDRVEPLQPAAAASEVRDYDTPSFEPAPPSGVSIPVAAYVPDFPDTPDPSSISERPARSTFSNPLVLGLAAVVVLLIAAMGWLLTRDSGGMRSGEGELVVQSRPEGAQVTIDGEVKGMTPLTVRLDAGAHVMEVQSGKSEPRVIPLMITAGVQTSQYVEMQGVAKTGSVEIRSEPAGARITIDGRPRGTTPATIGDLSPGDHSVVLESGGRKVSQTVRIQAGITAQMMVPIRR